MTGIPGESSNRGRAPFVGRAYETRELRDGFDRTLAGHGRVLLLVGEPGIGKSRLAEELEDEARERGALVLTGHCYEWEGAPAYWPWVQILRDCIRSVTADELEAAFGGVAPDIVRIMPELREAIPEVADPPDVNPEQARFRLFDGVTTGLRQLSGHQPLMILLEDLHWADEPSLLLLQFLAKEIADVPLLVVGTYRNVEIGRRHPLSRTLAELSRERRNRRIMLHGLEEADVAHYVALAGDDEADPELVTRIYRETEGNPFFVTEVVRLLADEGRLAAPNEPGDEWSLGIPESVRDVIGQRLEQLSDACNEMLSLAAAVGRDFDLQITGDAGQIEQEDLLALVDEATRAHVVAESATLGHYRFSHALIRELLYDELSSSERLRFHTRIADAIERQHAGNLAPYYADLAHHYALAPLGNNLDKAIEYALKAADQAMSAVAWETAITSYELALQLLTLQPQPDPYQECEILLGLGDAQNRAGAGQGTGAGRSEDGEATLWKAVDAARKSGSAEQLARAAIGIRGLNLYAPQGGNECLDLMEEALEQLPEEAGEFRALLLSRKAAGRWAYHSLQAFDAPRFTREQALIDVESALETATQTGSLTTLCEALLARFLILRGPDHTTRIEDAEEIAAVARRAENPQLILDALRTQVQALIGIGDYRTATWIVSQEMGTLVRELRIPLYEWQYNAFRAGLAFDAGQFDEAKRLASQAEQIWPESGSPRYLKIAISREEGRTEEFFENFPKHVQ